MGNLFYNPIFYVALFAIVALVYAYIKGAWVVKQDQGTEEMKKVGGHIREGAMAFLKSEYSRLSIFVVVVAILLAVSNIGRADSHWIIFLSFIVGAFLSGLSGFFGMRTATHANVRTANAARTSLNDALKVAFSGGSVMGLSVVGLAALGLSILFLTYSYIFQDWDITRIIAVLSGFSLGASSIALFARVGGGIYTKAADVGADLVGKVEAGIPEDDPRNPATIADNVGDNVGDVAGMGADLFESYVGSIIGAMILGGVTVTALKNLHITNANIFVYLPLIFAGVGIVASIIGTFFVKTKEGGDPQKALNTGTFIAAILMLIGTYALSYIYIPHNLYITVNGLNIIPNLSNHGFSAINGIFFATISGLIAGIAIGLITEYYTSEKRGPVHSIAEQATTGAATVIIRGLSVGMNSTALPVIMISAATLAAYYFAGLYGIAIAAFGMLSTTGIQLAVDAYGPVADNAGGIAEMCNLGSEVRAKTDRLDAVGNTTAAIGKGFAIGSAALTALALFSAFNSIVVKSFPDFTLNVLHPPVMVGIFIGAMLPFVFSALAMSAVGKAAFAMIEEVRRQFREIKGLLEGKATADYARCVEISTNAAIRKMVLPGLIAVITPVLIGFIDLSALGGMLIGVTVAGVAMAVFQANAGGAWDNAKKYIESGEYGGKGSDAHKAAVVGDTVGDPFKDTSGPSLNILIKLMSVVSVVTAPAMVGFHVNAAKAHKAVTLKAQTVIEKKISLDNLKKPDKFNKLFVLKNK